jgi:hypothetical protein
MAHAIEALMLVAEHGGDTMLPRIWIMRALYPGETEPMQRKKRARSIGSSGKIASQPGFSGSRTRLS